MFGIMFSKKGAAMPRRALSKSVQRIYDFICAYSAEHNYPPTVREIGRAVNLSSPSTVHMHLRTLEALGYIKRDPNKPRALEICDLQPHGAEKKRAEAEVIPFPVVEDPSTGLTTLPVVGRVAAGSPILAEENIEETLTLPTSLVGDGASFLLRVQGESMVDAGILDGDLIFVREEPSAENGEIVVALIDDSATVKTFYKEDGRVRLQPENPTMEPIYADNPRILGRVTGLLRTGI